MKRKECVGPTNGLRKAIREGGEGGNQATRNRLGRAGHPVSLRKRAEEATDVGVIQTRRAVGTLSTDVKILQLQRVDFNTSRQKQRTTRILTRSKKKQVKTPQLHLLPVATL